MVIAGERHGRMSWEMEQNCLKIDGGVELLENRRWIKAILYHTLPCFQLNVDAYRASEFISNVQFG